MYRFIALVLILTAQLALADDATPVVVSARKNHVSTGPQSIVSLAASAEYERAIAKHFTIFAGVEGSIPAKGITGSLGARFYPREALESFFLDAHAMATTATFETVPYRALGGGLLLGYAWQFDNGFEFSAGGGADMLDVRSGTRASTPSCFALPCLLTAAFDGGVWERTNPTLTDGLRVTPSVRVTVGYAF